MAEHCFDEISRKIVDEYLRDIVFIDEEAFGTESNPNSFDAKAVSKIFADAGKICAIYAPVNDTDIEHCSMLANNADVLVVDWRLLLHRTKPVDPNADAKDDIRGEYTSELLRLVLDDAQNDKFKMIVIYTGETDFGTVYDNLCAELHAYPLTTNKESFSLSSKNIEIVVRAKNLFKHNPEWNKFVITYENLPIEIVDIFTKKIKGLLPNYALSAITEIRKNTPQILSVFTHDIDAAYLGHEVSIEDKDDAQKLLNTCLGTAITDLLNFSMLPMRDWYEAWVDQYVKDSYVINFDNNKKITITNEFCKELLSTSGSSLKTRIDNILPNGQSISDKNAGKLKQIPARLFGYLDVADAGLVSSRFAKLTIYKNILKQTKSAPILSLGTVLKQVPSNDYFLCIQQSCDSQRIPLDGEGENITGRDFLFLPIREDFVDNKVGGKIILNDNIERFVDISSYSLVIKHFIPNADNKPIFAQKENERWIFVSRDNEKFSWEFDIKESYALRIVNKFASKLTRVGIDIAESIRMKDDD